MAEDKHRIKKRRHTAKRIYERLRDEHGFAGGITIVTDYVRYQKRRNKEVFVPLSHAPGHAQVDFGETFGFVDGVECKLHYFAMTLPHSDAVFSKTYPRETTEAFCDGHNAAFAFFGGVPQSILYDNTKIAVAKILGDGKRERTRVFSELQSHYLFEDKFGRPGKGNDKGNVEGMIGYVRRNLLVPAPRAASFDAVNAKLEEQCIRRQDDVLRGHRESIGERMLRDLDALMDLPPVAYDACEKVSTRATSISMVRYRCNDYSVAYAHHDVQVRGYIHEVIIGCGTDIIARHKRSYDKEDMIFDPLPLGSAQGKSNAFSAAAGTKGRGSRTLQACKCLNWRPVAAGQAAPLKGWNLPDAFATLHRLLEARMGKKGKREYVQVLRLLETFEMDHVHGGVKHALEFGAIGYDAVKHLVLCRIEKRPPRLDLEIYPYLPKALVETTDPASYLSLMPENTQEVVA